MLRCAVVVLSIHVPPLTCRTSSCTNRALCIILLGSDSTLRPIVNICAPPERNQRTG